MNIKHEVKSLKAAGRIFGHYACYEDLDSNQFTTKEAAVEQLGKLVTFRCTSESSRVQVLPLQGHVGIFSYDLSGFVVSKHAWPDGHVSETIGLKNFREAEHSFRYHLAQLTWDGKSVESDIVPELMESEFRNWAAWQIAYKFASEKHHYSDAHSRAYANEHFKSFLPVAQVSA